jgi:hypothetical protein
VVFTIWLGRKTAYKRFKRNIAIGGSLLVSIGSALAFTFGVLYIAKICFEGSDIFVGAYGIAAFFGWCWVCLLLNLIYLQLMKRRKDREDKAGVIDAHGNVVVFDMPTADDAHEEATPEDVN